MKTKSKKYELRRKNHFSRFAAIMVLTSYFILHPSYLSAQTPIRISGDSSVRYCPSIVDSNTSQSVQFVRGDFVTFDVGLFDQGRFRTNNILQFTNITVQIFDTQNSTNAPMMAMSIASSNQPWFNTNLSLANWTNNSPGASNYDVEFNFTDAQTSINLNSQSSQSYWLRVFGSTTDSVPRIVTYLEGPITVYDGPISPEYVAPNWAYGVFVDMSDDLLPSNTNFFAVNSNLLNQAVAAVSVSGAALLAGNNTFTGRDTFMGAVIVSNTANNVTLTLAGNSATGGTAQQIQSIPNGLVVGAFLLPNNGQNQLYGSLSVTAGYYGNAAPLTNYQSTNLVINPNFFAVNSNLLNQAVAPASGAALLAGNNTFTGSDTFMGAVIVSNTANVVTLTLAGNSATDGTTQNIQSTPAGLVVGSFSLPYNGQNQLPGSLTVTAGYYGNAAPLTNYQSTNLVINASTNDVTTAPLLGGGTNWSFFANGDYWTFLSNNICITNVQGLVAGADNWVNLFLRVTNSGQTVYISFAPYPSGPIPILNGFTNGWPLVYSQGNYLLTGHIYGTNWATNALWTLTNPSL
jgi:hypothetical protein